MCKLRRDLFFRAWRWHRRAVDLQHPLSQQRGHLWVQRWLLLRSLSQSPCSFPCQSPCSLPAEQDHMAAGEGSSLSSETKVDPDRGQALIDLSFACRLRTITKLVAPTSNLLEAKNLIWKCRQCGRRSYIGHRSSFYSGTWKGVCDSPKGQQQRKALLRAVAYHGWNGRPLNPKPLNGSFRK